ncbi:Smr/MutS family protein [Polymorphobacter sp.]|uniref:Smr/MutS family protein n=1 Tax=Polymorphobacter sp. TaxID=1909290 RepID=UPI003F70FA97
MSRGLSAQERALWARVAASVRPLAGRPRPPAALPAIPAPVLPPALGAAPIQTRQPQPPAWPPSRPSPPVLAATLDGGWDRRLSRGAVRPDRVIDLHDHSLAHAHQALAMAVEDASHQGARLLLVITGKGRADRPGRIRGELSHWLEQASIRRHVAALRPASLRHGGSGAFYLVLKRT